MFSKENIKYSLRNLEKNKGRSFLTIFSILVGIATIFIFISFGYGLFTYIEELSSSSSADKVLIMPQSAGGITDITGGNTILNDTDIDAIKKSPGVYDATGMYAGAAEVKKDNQLKYVFLTGYDPKKEDIMLGSFNIETTSGRTLKQGDTNKVLAGYNYLLPDKIFNKPLKLNDNLEVNGEKLRVIGFMEEIGNPTDDSNLYVTNEKFEEMKPDIKSYVQIMAVVDTSNIDRVVEDIERSLRNSRDIEKGKEDFTVQSFNDLMESFSGALNIVIGFIILIASISILVSAINTANTMITSVLERYKEIGILKAVGARNPEIFEIFLFESSFLGFIAGVLGCILGWGISFIGGQILKDFGWGFLQPYFSIYLFIGLILFSTITGGISGVLPAIRASKTNPVDALRHE